MKLARASGTIGHDWGGEYALALGDAAAQVEAIPVTGGPGFRRAMEAAGDALASVRENLPAGYGQASASP